MADFHQTGVISTLHRLGRPDLDRLERDLRAHARARPIALVLPCLYSELHDGALKGLIDELTRVTYLAQVLVSVAGTDRPSEFNEMRDATRQCGRAAARRRP
jgi:glucosyl-3-phosphoglycerate synthase